MSENAHLRTVLSLLLTCTSIASIVLIPVGIGLLCADTTVTHVEDYPECQGTDIKRACMATVVTRDSEHYSECVCRKKFELKQAITGDVTLYYEIEFDQTDAAYASSRDESQLRGEPGAAPAHSCGDFSYDGGRAVFPCGELAYSMFNDTFSSLKAENEAEPYDVSYIERLEGEATTAFSNPPPEVWDKSEKNNVWDSGSHVTGVQNEPSRACMCRMRKPVFRVVDPALRDGLPAGNYEITINIHSPLPKNGSKKFVLVGEDARARARYVEAGAAALAAAVGAAMLAVLLLVIALKRGYYVINIRAVMGRVLASIRTSRVVVGSAAILRTVAGAVLALYGVVARNKTSILQKVKSLPYPLIAGMTLVLLSIGFLANVHTTVKTIHIEDYSKCHGTDVRHACVAQDTGNYTECACSWPFELKQPISGDVSLYCVLDFDQTAYASSRDDSQLRGAPGAAPAPSRSAFRYDGGRPILPCDSCSSLKLDDKPIVISYTGTFAEDPAYRNPPEDDRAGCKPVYRVVDPALPDGLPAGNYTITIKIHIFSEKYGSKKFVLEGVSVHVQLTYAVLGACALVAGILVSLYGILRLKETSRDRQEIQQTSHTTPAANVAVGISKDKL